MALRAASQARQGNETPEPITPPTPPTPAPSLQTNANLPVPELSTSLVSELVRISDRQTQAPRIGGEYIHLTALMNFCPRMNVLAERHGVYSNPSPRSVDRIIWEMGRGVERYIRQAAIDARPDLAWGNWSCPCGYARISQATGEEAFESSCLKCDGVVDIYHEATLFDHESGVSGNPDLILKLTDARLHPIEIKSIKKDGDPPSFTSLQSTNKPLPDHAVQVMGYERMLRIGGHATTGQGTVIYACKQAVADEPYKEFLIESPRESQDALDSMFYDATIHKQHREAGTTPDRLRVCTSRDCVKARSCPLGTICFSLED